MPRVGFGIPRRGWPGRLAVLALVWSAQGVVLAQTPHATFRGVVRDSTGGVLAGAEIVLTNVDTGWRAETLSRDNGSYHIPLVPPGRYELSIKHPGLAPLTSSGLAASGNQEVSFDPVLLPAPLEERVEVSDLEPTRSEIGTTLPEPSVQSIPVDARDVLNLALLSPGAFPGRQGAYDGQVEVAVGGLMGIDNTLTLDGSVINDPTFGFPITPLPLDAVEEFHFLTHRYGAEVGGGSGGAMALVTKSGTNQLRGSVFGFLRDESLDARDPFAPRTSEQRPFRRTQFGATLGGPIRKDRSHFFVAYDGSHSDQRLTVDTAGTRPELERTLSVTHDIGALLGKVDVAAGRGHRLTVRFNRGSIQDRNFGFGPSAAESARFTSRLVQQAAEVAHLWRVGPDKHNELRVQYFDGGLSQTNNSSAPFEIRPSSRTGGTWFRPNGRDDARFQLVESFTWYVPRGAGGHVLRIGGELLSNANATRRTVYSPVGAYIFETDAPFDPRDLLTFPVLAIFGYSESEERTVRQSALYIGDDWSVNGRLALNLGLRYELESGSLNDDIANPVTYLAKPSLDTNNVAPRVGFALKLDRAGRTVLRGGYGLYYTRLYGILDFTGSRGTSQSVRFVANPDYRGVRNPLGSETAEEKSLNGTSPNAVIPYSHQFSFGVDRGLGRHWAVSLDYVGMRGRREIVQIDSNPPDARGKRAHLEFGFVPIIDSLGHSLYDGLQVHLRSRGASWGRVGIAYTLSRARNDHTWFYTVVKSKANLAALDGYSLNDQRHRLVANGVWEMPWRFKLAGVLTLASGQPYDTNTGEDKDGDGVFDRPPGVARNSARVDGFYRLDARLSRLFALGRVTLEPVIEAFNASNRVNVDPDTVNRNLKSPKYGKGGSTLHPLFTPRQVQIGLRVSF